jgi:hypothetical protein
MLRIEQWRQIEPPPLGRNCNTELGFGKGLRETLAQFFFAAQVVCIDREAYLTATSAKKAAEHRLALPIEFGVLVIWPSREPPRQIRHHLHHAPRSPRMVVSTLIV